MTPRVRLIVLLLAFAVLLPAVLHVAGAMPPFGAHPLPYGDAINALGTSARHVTNMVSFVNFDARAIDTLGEECILLGAVTGTTVLLRGTRGENMTARPGRVADHELRRRSSALILAARLSAVTTFVFGLYVMLHAMTTPGGGFQGGVIMATATLLIFLGESYEGWRRMIRSEMMDALEGVGAALFALSGFAACAAGAPFLANVLPLGTPGDMLSGGSMLVVNLGVALAVGGGLTVLFIEFLEETRAEANAGEPGDDA